MDGLCAMFCGPARKRTRTGSASGLHTMNLADGRLISGTSEPLGLCHRPLIERGLSTLRRGLGQACLSEYSFANLYLFRTVHQYTVTKGEIPFVSGVTYDGKRHLLPLCDMTRVNPDRLRELMGHHDCIFPVSEAVLSHLDPGSVTWDCVRADADYVYQAQRFSDYRGSRLRKRRDQMNWLLKAHDVSVQPLNASTRDLAANILAGWMEDKSQVPGGADAAPCLDALNALDLLGLEGFVYCADGYPAGFMVTERLSAPVQVIRFAKGRDAFRGIYPYMFHHFCSGVDRNVEWLNFEQDLGQAGLRRSKKSYDPVKMLHKYRLRFLPKNG